VFLLGAGAALGIASLVRSTPSPEVVTVVQKPRIPPSPVALDSLVLQSTDGRTLNDAAYFLIKAGEYARAIPFAQRAVHFADRSTSTYGYATFNLGLALLKVGQCSRALPLLRRALSIEAPEQRPFIRPRVAQARSCVQGGASGPAPSRLSAAATASSRAR
jgi:Tfp pilus assembly protein PilF